MNVFHAWLQSLSIFKPERFKLFAYTTIRATVSCYGLLIRYWWWMLLLFPPTIAAQKILTIGQATISWWVIPISLLLFVLQALILLASNLAARPSVDRKTASYFWNYSKQGILFTCGSLAAIRIIKAFLHYLTATPAPFFTPVFDLLVEPFLGYAFLTIVTLFYCDLVRRPWAGLHAFRLGFKMTSCAYPPLFFLTFLATLLHAGTYTLISFFHTTNLFTTFVTRSVLLSTLSYALIPLFVCIVTNLYIIELHQQPERYFDQPNEKQDHS